MSEVAVVFGMQRSGSNFFLSACKRFEDLTVFGEMYHRDGVFPFRQVDPEDFAVKAKLAACIRGTFPEDNLQIATDWNFSADFTPQRDAVLNQALALYSHEFPGKYFECMREIAPASRMVFKIFPEHLSIMQMLMLLVKYRPRVVLMTRNPLDSFISFKKLLETRKPQDVDTSALKIAFYRVEYYEYKAQLAAYFNAIHEFCAEEGLQVSTVSYESLHQDDGQDKVEKVRQIMEGVFQSPMRLRADASKLSLFTKQDQAGSPAEKVLNPGRLPRLAQRLIDTAAGA
jgi:hypothetical protein